MKSLLSVASMEMQITKVRRPFFVYCSRKRVEKVVPHASVHLSDVTCKQYWEICFGKNVCRDLLGQKEPIRISASPSRTWPWWNRHAHTAVWTQGLLETLSSVGIDPKPWTVIVFECFFFFSLTFVILQIFCNENIKRGERFLCGIGQIITYVWTSTFSLIKTSPMHLPQCPTH